MRVEALLSKRKRIYNCYVVTGGDGATYKVADV